MTTPRHFWLLVCIALLHSSITLVYALTRLYTYKASLLDIGLFDQLLWNLKAIGLPLTTATLPFTPQHWLGFHFSPLLFAFYPLYLIWPHIELFQVIQSLCFGVAAIPLFYGLRVLGASTSIAWLFTLLYWSNPLVLSAAIWDFHEIALSTLCISLALYALCAKRFHVMLIALALLLLTKEHYGIAVAGFGFLWGWHHREWKRSVFVIFAGLLVAFCVIKIIMPYFGGGAHPMLSDDGTVVSRYGWLFGTWPERWSRFWGLMLGDGTPQITGIMHVMLLLLSGLLFPLLAPLYLAPAAADIAANLLSANPMPRHIASYHAAACIPVFIIAGAKGWITAQRYMPHAKKLLVISAIMLATIMPIGGLTLLPFNVWELSSVTLAHPQKPLQDITSIVGDAPLVAQANIGMFFSQRSAIYPYPNKMDDVDYILLHLHRPFNDPERSNFNIPFGTDTHSFAASVTALMHSTDWHIAYWQESWLLLKRGKADGDETSDRQSIQSAVQKLTQKPTP